MWLREQIGPQAYTVNSSILWLGLNKDEHPSPCVEGTPYTVCRLKARSRKHPGLGIVSNID